MMLVVGMVVAIILLINENNELKKEINRLKMLLASKGVKENKPVNKQVNKSFFCPVCGEANTEESKGVCKNCLHVLGQDEIKNITNVASKPQTQNMMKKPAQVLKPVKNIEEAKNNAILITGAVLIILSAILFLATTWNTSENYLKTIILVFMFLVFLATSKIAENVFKLDTTARAFFNIALSYLPILLFSVSLFGLTGDYLSISGDGKYIYFSLTSMIVTLIYYIYSIKKSSNFLKVSSYVFLALSEILLELIFTNDFCLIISGLFLFNTLTTYLLPKLLDITYEYSVKKYNIVMFMALGIISILYVFPRLIENGLNASSLVLFISGLIASKLVLSKHGEKEIYEVVYPVLVELIIYNASRLLLITSDKLTTDDGIILLSVLTLGVLFMSIIEVLRKKELSINLYIEFFVLLCIFIYTSMTWSLKVEYLIIVVLSIITYEIYKFSKEYKYITKYLLPALVNLSLVFTFIDGDINFLYLPVIMLAIFTLAHVYNVDASEKDAFKMVTTPFIVFSTLANIVLHFNSVLTDYLILIASINFLVYGLIDKKALYKVLSYILLNVFMCKIFCYAPAEVYFIATIPVATIIITLINELISGSKVKGYLTVQYIFAFFYINIPEVSGHTMLYLASLILVYYLFVSDKNKMEKYLPLASIIPLIYFKDSFLSDITVLISSVMIITFTLISSIKKDINDYTKITGIYLLLHCICFDEKYISLILLVFAPLIFMLTTYYKQKDAFKFLTYISVYILALNLINDFYKDYSIILFVIISTYMMLLATRSVLKKYIKDYKIIEYLFLALINLYAVGNITSESDAIVVTLFFLINVIIGFLYKMGPLLAVSLISLLYAVFRLTESFWLSISWWVYVLMIGCVLVIFAINNELTAKQNKPKLDFEKIKKKLDL